MCSGLCLHQCSTEMPFAVSCQGMDLMGVVLIFFKPLEVSMVVPYALKDVLQCVGWLSKETP